ncbi:hypothetical protein QYF36_020281 [Acer negundo]|nr:hypothetical protein QYF36_020281 [Acer negundo]
MMTCRDQAPPSIAGKRIHGGNYVISRRPETLFEPGIGSPSTRIGFTMSNLHIDQFKCIETTCGSLLVELQRIWDEVGEPDVERDKMVLNIEQQCLAVYRRKVEEAKSSRAQLHQTIAHSKAEIADICSSLAEQSVKGDWKACGNLKEELETIIPQLEDLRKRKMERKNQFVEVLIELQKISNEIYSEDNRYKSTVDETNLSVKRLDELRMQLLDLQNEKSNRLKQVVDQLSKLNSLCLVLGVDFKETICKIHPALDNSKAPKDVSNSTIEKLANKIRGLQEVKMQRMQKLQYLASSLLELWDLMDTPIEEQQMFQNVTSNIVASESEITEPNMLSMDNIKYVEGEVSRLEQFKSVKIKEVILKKRLELEEICRKTHMVTEGHQEYSIEAIESGPVDPLYLLEQTELQIANAKEEAFSRKEILDKVEKWFAAREEECWLEEYSRDDNRYNAGRGTHLNLKRAERARALVNKIPAMVETLTSRVSAWEKERGIDFFYDGLRLLNMLKDYINLRQEKEQEKQRHRDQKKLQVQLIAEQEALYGSKPSPPKSVKKASRPSTGIASNRKLSLGGAMLQNLKPEKAAPRVNFNKKVDCVNRYSPLSRQHSGGFSAHSGRRNSENDGPLVKKHPSGAVKARGVVESPLIRNPLSPVKANILNFLEDQKRTQSGTLQTTLPGSKTPSKSTFVGNDENRTTTPKTMPIPVPMTPKTVSVPMLTAMTPATPCVLSFGPRAIQKIEEQVVEYSFEEVRAGLRQTVSAKVKEELFFFCFCGVLKSPVTDNYMSV